MQTKYQPRVWRSISCLPDRDPERSTLNLEGKLDTDDWQLPSEVLIRGVATSALENAACSKHQMVQICLPKVVAVPIQTSNASH